MLDRVTTIVQKEIKDAIRDPGAIIAALLYTFIGPALVWTIMIFLSNNLGSNRTANMVIDVQGANQSSNIVQFLIKKNFTIQENVPIKVIISDNLEAELANGKQGNIIIEADISKHGIIVGSLRNILNEYGDIIIKERLAPYNLSTDYIQPIRIVIDNPETTSVLTKSLVSLITLSFCMAIAFTGMSLSIDMTVGERERLTLEPLLAQPVTPIEIITGKWSTSIIMAMIGSGLTATVLTIIFATSSYTVSGLEFTFNGYTALKIFISLLPLCALFSSIQIAVALFARTYKEGIYYLSLTGIGPMAVSFMDADMVAKLDYLPLFWEATAIKKIILDDATFIMPGSALLFSILITAICLHYSQKRLKQEKMLF